VGALSCQPFGAFGIDLGDRMAQRHFDIGRIASGPRSLVAHQRQQAVQLRTGYAQGLEAVTEASGPSSGRFAMAADVYRKMLSSNGFRAAYHVFELKELTIMGDALSPVIPERPQHRQLFVGAPPPTLKFGAACLDFFAQPADTDTQSKPPARQRINGRRSFGQNHRMMVGQHQDSSGQPESIGMTGQE